MSKYNHIRRNRQVLLPLFNPVFVSFSVNQNSFKSHHSKIWNYPEGNIPNRL